MVSRLRRPAHGDGGVVDHDVEGAQLVPDLQGQLGAARSMSPRSAAQALDRGAVSRQSSATSSRRSARRATRATVVPPAASRRAVAAPMPEEAPVTRATDPDPRRGVRAVPSVTAAGEPEGGRGHTAETRPSPPGGGR